jgi:HK97 family phage major capsid protein
MEWVAGVINGTKHSPFSRIKTVYADITGDDARAKGYTKGNLKDEEFFGLYKRTTIPSTIYKKQKLDRDDIIDITDLDVVAWLKAEMRMMLDEEIARAVLIGDGRALMHIDKIDETTIRPIYTDADVYAVHTAVASDHDTEELIEDIIRARKDYKGSGNPTFYVNPDTLIDMLLLKDNVGRRLYPTVAELAAILRVSSIVEVPVMEDLTRLDPDDGAVTLALIGIIVNLNDYTIGADKGGAISMFDDFDIDYNQYKYLIETRCSGALTKLSSALVIEQIQT